MRVDMAENKFKNKSLAHPNYRKWVRLKVTSKVNGKGAT